MRNTVYQIRDRRTDERWYYESWFFCNTCYNGTRLALAHITGEHECFSIEDMMEITGESREEVLKQVEDMRAAALAAGENPDDYAVPVERKILYFPDGFTS